MKIVFLGTGEAFDPDRRNVSYLLFDRGKSLMVDCGYDSPKSLMIYLRAHKRSIVDVPDSLLLTHEHGDHTGGISALLMAIWEEANGVVGERKDGIKRGLEVLSANGELLKTIPQDMERYYKGFYDRFKTEGPSLQTRALNPPEDNWFSSRVRYAQSSHGAVNFAYRVTSSDGKSLAISGDGAMTDDTRELYRGVDLLIHEGFNVSGSGGKNHASIEQVVDFAIAERIPRVAIVHVNRQERKKLLSICRLMGKAQKSGVQAHLAEDYEEINL